MPLVSAHQLLAGAARGGYAVTYCESWNLESLQAVLDAAEETQSPVFVGFNGSFLRHSQRSKPENLAYYAALGKSLESLPIPAALLLNESDSVAQIKQAIELGFNAVMLENENLSPGEYRRLVSQVVEFAHPRNVWVEAQAGRLANASDRTGGEPTDIETARILAEEVGVDALSVAVGNIHIATNSSAELDFEKLAKIHAAVRIPLVLHGGTGIPLAMLQRTLKYGVAKVNFGTNLKQVYLAAIREGLAKYQELMSPHPFMGMGGDTDILVAGRMAVKRKASELMQALGSAGKAAPGR